MTRRDDDLNLGEGDGVVKGKADAWQMYQRQSYMLISAPRRPRPSRQAAARWMVAEEAAGWVMGTPSNAVRTSRSIL